jgi:magnesium chelatase accessory protein
MDWERQGRDWPNRQASRLVSSKGLRWHVQQQGEGPVLLLLHGTGASTHSWRDLLPLLAAHFTVVAPDLPGHGFTATPAGNGLSLPGMSRATAALLETLQMTPAMAVGHSAGAAVLLRMALDGRIRPRSLVSLNGALLPLRGLPGRVFSPVARVLARSSLVPRLFAWRASDRVVIERLLRDTGSRLDAQGIELYRRLARDPGHVAAALRMMASWDLHELEREIQRLDVPLTLVVGGNDGTVSPDEAGRVRARLSHARIVTLPKLGHLAHEERPAEVAELLIRLAREAGVLTWQADAAR